MRPPICEICDRDFDPHKEGGLIDFKETPEGRAFDKRVAEEGIVGHPPDTGWFCGDHIEQARELTHLTISEACRKIRADKAR